MTSVTVAHKGLRARLSIEKRIVAAALATAVAVLAAASAAFFAQQWRGEVSQIAREQQAAAHAALTITGEPDTPEAAGRLLTALADAPGLTSARVLDPSGRLLAVRVMARPSVAGEPPREVVRLRGGGRLVLTGGGARLSRLLPETLALCGALFFMATGLALFLGRGLARRVIEPLDGLSAFMREVTGHADFHRRAPPSAVFEVSRLTDSFNDLLQRLQAHDAALQRTVDELVEARDAAEAANVMKSQFLANMSHEIRTPLNGVLAMAQVISLGELDDVQRDRLRVVRESGEALLAVLNDVLDVSKIEAGRLELEEGAFDLGAVVKSACDAFAAALAERSLDFSLEIAPQARGWRRGDEVRLRQVLVNLLSNAVKFTEQGSVRVRVEGGAEGLLLEVSDTGLGVAADELPHLFDKFTQADATITRRFGGTGLGLAICRELVELMGGRIEVESRLGHGSTFRIELPLQAAAAPASAQPSRRAAPEPTDAPHEADERPLRVLAAEDNPTNQLVLTTIMGVFGVELEMVADGRRAVEAWRAGAFDLILMDIQMPEMDGMAATRAIRAAERDTGRARTPIIALSANAMTHQVRDYLAAGMDDHVPKPIELARLQAALVTARDPQRHVEAA